MGHPGVLPGDKCDNNQLLLEVWHCCKGCACIVKTSAPMTTLHRHDYSPRFQREGNRGIESLSNLPRSHVWQSWTGILVDGL